MKESRKRKLAWRRRRPERRAAEYVRAEAARERYLDKYPRLASESAGDYLKRREREKRGARVVRAKEEAERQADRARRDAVRAAARKKKLKLWTPPKHSAVRPGTTRLASGLIVPDSVLKEGKR